MTSVTSRAPDARELIARSVPIATLAMRLMGESLGYVQEVAGLITPAAAMVLPRPILTSLSQAVEVCAQSAQLAWTADAISIMTMQLDGSGPYFADLATRALEISRTTQSDWRLPSPIYVGSSQ